MTQTTFGYDQEEDRLWLCYHDEQPRIWLTRRFAQGLIGPMAELIERTATLNQVTGLAPYDQIRMEHRLAVQETPTGESHYPFRVSQEDRESHRAQGFVLCKVLRLHMEPHGCNINMQTDEGEVNFALSRHDNHLWLRAFRMALDNADWNLPTLPKWLTESVLPPAIANILNSPIPQDIQDEMNQPDPDQPPPAQP